MQGSGLGFMPNSGANLRISRGQRAASTDILELEEEVIALCAYVHDQEKKILTAVHKLLKDATKKLEEQNRLLKKQHDDLALEHRVFVKNTQEGHKSMAGKNQEAKEEFNDLYATVQALSEKVEILEEIALHGPTSATFDEAQKDFDEHKTL